MADDPTALTADELHAMDLTAELMNTLSRVVGNGRTRDHDLTEIAGHIHVVQHLVLAQAAGRCYPDRFRLLGESLAMSDVTNPMLSWTICPCVSGTAQPTPGAR